MKKSQVTTLALLVICCCWLGLACKKGHSNSTITPSLSFQTTNSSDNIVANIHFPVVVVAVQEVDTLHTTTISAQYSDTSTLVGNLSIHVIGDTTGTYKGNSLLATYVDGQGNAYNNTGDSTDFVTITRFQKNAGGTVTGSFSLTLSGNAGSVKITNGQFITGFLD